MLKKLLDAGIVAFGALSFLSLCGYFLALHDIWHDYASPEIWARAGQSIPTWFSHGWHECRVEWGMLQVGFLLMAVFHALLFVRFINRLSANWKGSGEVPMDTRDWGKI